MRTKTKRRADVLSAYARRAIFALRAQRERLAVAPAPHDIDFYAHAAWQLPEAGGQARGRLSLAAAAALLDELDEAVPRLREYRDVMTHAVDDGLENIAWFGDRVGEILDGGVVEYIIDTRFEHHEALETFFAGLIDALEPFCSDGTAEMERARTQTDSVA